MNVTDKLKAISPGDPKTVWDRVIASTPVVMTVVATILAGLSSSEMSTAQYNRAMAAQFQSKAGDQWSFYQAKKLRESSNQGDMDLLETLTSPGTLDAQSFTSQLQDIQRRLERIDASVAALVQGGSTDAGPIKDILGQSRQQVARLEPQWVEALGDPKVIEAIKYLTTEQLPVITEQHREAPAITQVLEAIDEGKNERDTVDLVRQVKRADLDAAEVAATDNANAFDLSVKPIDGATDRVGLLVASETAMLRRLQRDAVSQLSSNSADGGDVVPVLREIGSLRQAGDELAGAFSVARLGFDARRYHQESVYNFAVARLYEVEVRRSSGLSDRNRERSKNFFYGMLVAQAAVTIATFSLALRQQSILWALASGAGALAIGLGIYVYIFT